MRTHTRIQLARRGAEALIERLSIRSAPVDVNFVARSLGLQIVYNDLGDDISGLLVTHDGNSSICVRESEPVARQRFTIAHEIGHFVMRHQFEEDGHVHVDEGWKVTARSSAQVAGADPKEVEANQFAAALLMPSELLQQRAIRFGERQLREEHVTELAREFKVSEQAMALRLAALHL
jgi:Zn-dependent peptidase ImmA (M78 family)